MTFDYAWLTKSTADFLNRADLYGTIPTFIALAEAELARDLERQGVQGAITRAQSTTINAEFETTPADFAGPVSMRVYDTTVSTWKPLENVTPTGMATLKSSREKTAAIPDRYAVVGGSFEFCPTPDQAYQVDLIYLAAMAALSTSNTTNWVITNHPDAYLYGTLSHGAPYVSNPVLSKAWGDRYVAAVSAIVESERRKRGSMFTPSFRATDTPPNYGRRRWSFNINSGL